MNELLEHLNPQQRQAVLHESGPLLVFAGAGSGKTRVITHRIAYLVRERGVRPWNILAVTFTNKAAKEMRSRVDALAGEALSEAWVGTFHATCARLLRRHGEAIGLSRDFVIFDDRDQETMVKRCFKELNIDDRRFPVRVVQGKINAAKRECLSPESYEPRDYFEDQVAKIYRLYDEKMRASAAVDFGDLIFKTVVLLEEHPEVREHLQNRFRHILVDEFQDTNFVQYRLLGLLVGPERNLCVVGDDDQSIYRWRGADVRNILNFREDYPDATVVTLEQNYRSTGHILASAMAVIRRNRTRAPKNLWTEEPAGEKLRVATLSNEREEASFVVHEIKEALRQGMDPGDIAVFYRVNAQSRVLEEELRRANIAYRIVGGLKFYERQEVKDLIAYLRVIHNPLNELDLLRIINRPARKIGQTTVKKLLEQAARDRCGLWDLLERIEDAGVVGKAVTKRLVEFRELIRDLRVAQRSMGPSDLARYVLDRTGYLERLERDDSAESETRAQNIKELVGSFEEFERFSDDATLSSLLESITLVQDVDDLEERPRAVTLMTVHSAKGLEFPVVFITGMEEDVFPFYRANEAEDELERKESLEEERRLAYVAITRARRRLYLTNVVTRRLFGTERYVEPSRFLDDLPPESVEVWGTSMGGPPRRRGDVTETMTLPGALGAGRRSGTARGRSSPRRGAGGGGAVLTTPAWAEDLNLDEALKRSSRRRRRGGDLGKDEVVTTFDDSIDSEMELRPGMKVRHVRFGVGRVESVQAGSHPKAVVEFPRFGKRTIMTRYLSPV